MLGINSSINNTGYQNNSPKFGMTVKMASSAIPVIKKQAAKMKPLEKNKFLSKFKQNVDTQLTNDVDVILRKAKFRNALAAEVVDSKAGQEIGKLRNKTFTQPFIKKNGNLDFFDRAISYANDLRATNNDVKELVEHIPEAKIEDYGKVVKHKK